jgi:hypothetical protein
MGNYLFDQTLKKIERFFSYNHKLSIYLITNTDRQNKMPSKKQSRNNKKSSSQVAKPMANATTTEEESDDGFGSIAILMRTASSSRSSTQSNKSKKSVEEAAPAAEPEPVPEWEQVGMTKEAYEALCQKIAKEMVEAQLQSMRESYLQEMDTIAYWSGRIDSLNKHRERYNKKREWSAEIIDAVEQIDKDIKECQEEINRIQNQGCQCQECIPQEEYEEEEWEKCNGCGKWYPEGEIDSCPGYGSYCSRACGPSGYARDYGRD